MSTLYLINVELKKILSFCYFFSQTEGSVVFFNNEAANETKIFRDTFMLNYKFDVNPFHTQLSCSVNDQEKKPLFAVFDWFVMAGNSHLTALSH